MNTELDFTPRFPPPKGDIEFLNYRNEKIHAQNSDISWLVHKPNSKRASVLNTSKFVLEFYDQIGLSVSNCPHIFFFEKIFFQI